MHPDQLRDRPPLAASCSAAAIRSSVNRFCITSLPTEPAARAPAEIDVVEGMAADAA
ncbi:MAG TPA: hypothetical protein VEB19_02395 [Gemmatimonadaceae bacterium]|nr:hypothetical protein [Gemmatimonadaceae bacterium]